MPDFFNLFVHVFFGVVGLCAGFGLGVFSRAGIKIAGDAANEIEDEVSKRMHRP